MRTGSGWSTLIAIVVLIVALLDWRAGALPAVGATSTEMPLVRIGSGETPSYTVSPGSEQTITVEVVGAANLGAAVILLAYDPALVQVVGCTAQLPADVDLALCNSSYSPGVVRFSLLAAQGVNGAFPLFSLTLRALAASGATAQLAVTAPQFADTRGVEMPVQVSGGALVISGPDQPAEALLRLDPAHSEIAPGQLATIGVHLDVIAAQPVMAATLFLQYDPHLVRPVQCTAAAESSLQGACNVNFNRTQGLVKFNLLAAEGASGPLELYDIVFEVVGTALPNAVSPLTLSVETITDAASAPLRWRAEGGSLTIGASPANAAQLRVGDVQSNGQFTLEHGALITIPVWVVDVTDLGAATIDLGFDPALLEPIRCLPIAINGGHCVIEDRRVLANFVAGQGFSGSAPLFEVVFTPRAGAPTGESASLLIHASNFADVNAAPLPWRARSGEIILLPGDPSNVPLFELDAPITAPPSLPQDGELTVTLSLSGAVDVGVAAVEVHFDRAVANLVSCTANTEFDGTVCRVGEGEAQITILDGRGFTGSTPMATLVFRAADAAEVGAQTNLTLRVLNFTDVAGSALRYQVSTGAIQITEATNLASDLLLRLTPDLFDVIPGRQFQVRLEALLDGFALSQGVDVVTLRLLYDPAVLQPLACAHNTDAFLGGACNLAFAPGEIRLSLVGGDGLSSQMSLAQMQFQTVGQPGASTPLRLEVVELLTESAAALSVRTQRAQVAVTLDGDGVPDVVENGAPNHGDGNADGIPDAEQLHVTSLPSPITGDYVTLEAGIPAPSSRVMGNVETSAEPASGCLIDLRFLSNPSPEDTPSGWSAELGFLGFTLGCLPLGSSATVTVSLHSAGALDLTHFFTYAPPPAATGWRSFLRNGNLGASFTSTGMVLQLADGQNGDNDAAVNGEIEFLGAPGKAGVAIGVAPRSLTISPSRAGTYGVVLLARPLAPVLVNLSTAGRAVVSPAQLTFTLDNWSVMQMVTVRTASGLTVPNSDLIQHSASSTDAVYNGLAIHEVAVVVQEESGPTPETGSPTATRTPTADGGPQTATATPTATRTSTADSGAQTATATPTATRTSTADGGPQTATATPTATRTASRTPTSTPGTGTPTVTPTRTPTADGGPQTATATATQIPTADGGRQTATATATRTSTADGGPQTATATATATRTPTAGSGPRTATATPTATRTPTADGGPQTATPTATATRTSTADGGPQTATPTATATANGGPQTVTATATATANGGPQTVTATATATPTNTSLPSTATPTATSALSIATATVTVTPGQTPTSTQTQAPVQPSRTSTATATHTPTQALIPPTATSTVTPMATATFTATPTATLTNTPTHTTTSTATPTHTTTSTIPTPTATSTATPTQTATNTPGQTPTATPQAVLQILRLEPNQGLSTVPNEVAIYGAGLHADTQITIGGVALNNYTLTDEQGKLALAVVPRGLVYGVHDVNAVNPGRASFTLPGGYTVIDDSLPDLSVANSDIWSSPVTMRTGAEAAIGVNIHRSGGSETLPGVDVAFYLNEISSGALLGRRTTGTFMPGNDVSASVSIFWTPPAAGSYRIYAVVDPDGAVAEGTETNNLAQWSVEVLPPPDILDTTPPTVTAVIADGGAQSTTRQDVTLEISATDQGSGILSMYIVERVYNNSARAWVMVQESGWITYSVPHVQRLSPVAGIHYLQVWVADDAGNSSNASASASINYLPAQSTVRAGQVRIYRLVLAAGDPLRVAVTPQNGDPDLYIWDEESNLVAYSNSYDETPELVAYTAPRRGVYQIEVHGYTDSNYAMTLEPNMAQLAQAASTPADKVLPLTPSIAPTIIPPAQQALPVAPVAPPPNAIGLISFEATFDNGVVLVNWVTGWEQNTFGFHIYRGETNEFANALRLTQELIPGKGSSGGDTGYRYTDSSALPDQIYWYWLVEQEFSGAMNHFGPIPTATIPSTDVSSHSVIFLPLVTR